MPEKLNYSDKAISKWERAESVPDVAILKQIADLFGVKVDYLLVEEHAGNEIRTVEDSRQDRKNKTLVAWLASGLIWLIATMVFVYMGIYTNGIRNLWIIYVYAFPLTVVVLLVFNSIWGEAQEEFFHHLHPCMECAPYSLPGAFQL